MAFLLAKRLENQLTTKSRLTDDSFKGSRERSCHQGQLAQNA